MNKVFIVIVFLAFAYAGWQRLQAGQHEGAGFQVNPRWPMSELQAVEGEARVVSSEE